MSYDLHSHSYYSDGQLSPESLLELASQVGVNTLALTDHDTLSGLPRAQQAAQKERVQLITGVELSCIWHGQLLHLVGLNIDVDSDCLNEGVEANKKLRLQRAQAMHDDFLKHGLDLQQDVLKLVHPDSVPTRPHFAQALINLGKAKNKQQAFKRYLVRGKPGFIPMQWPELKEVVQWVRAAGGVAVLAHPARYQFTRTKLCRLIEQMKEFGVLAMEVSTAQNTPAQTKQLSDLAIEYDLYASVGSDFHALNQPWAKLGSACALSDNLKPVWHAF